MMPVGADIRRLRESLRMTQPVFAQLLGIVVCTLSRWERGLQPPDEFRGALMTAFARAPSPHIVGPEVARTLRDRGTPAALHLILKYALENRAATAPPPAVHYTPPKLPAPPPGVPRTNPRAAAPVPPPPARRGPKPRALPIRNS